MCSCIRASVVVIAAFVVAAAVGHTPYLGDYHHDRIEKVEPSMNDQYDTDLDDDVVHILDAADDDTLLLETSVDDAAAAAVDSRIDHTHHHAVYDQPPRRDHVRHLARIVAVAAVARGHHVHPALERLTQTMAWKWRRNLPLDPEKFLRKHSRRSCWSIAHQYQQLL